MKRNQTLLAMTIAGGLVLAGEVRANIVYTVNEPIGAGGVVGTITTDGTNGVIGTADILAWNLTVTGNGGVTYNLNSGDGLSGVEVGNNTDVFNPNAGTPDLTADAMNIYFNFSATDGGYLGFQTLPFYGGQQYWSCGANDNSDCAQGLAAVPILYSDPSSIYVAEAGNQIIASASIVPSGTQPNSFTYNNFASTPLIQFNGSAADVTTGDGPVLELTPASANQAGSAFTSNHIVLDPNDGFGTFFNFRLSQPGNTPAGGITFTIQSAGSHSLGSSGSGLGYSGITNSLSVGFDAGNQVSVSINGVLAAATNSTFTDGNIWYAWVDYEGVSQDLEVRLSEIPVRPLAPTLAVGVNLVSVLGGTNAFVGFTGATGAGWHQQDILAWKFMALPTTRITGSFALTNLSPGFQVSGGVVLAQYRYVVAGHTYTNFSFAPITVATNANGQLTFTTKPGELVPESALPDPDAIDIALSNNAAALDANDFMEYAVFAAYENSTTVGEGAILSSYDNGAGFPPFLQNADFNTRYPIYEDDYVNEIYNMDQNSYPGLDPEPGIVEIGQEGASDGTESAPVEAPMDADGNYGADLAQFSLGTYVGTVAVRQQVISSPPLPLIITSPRRAGTSFVFDFGTVSNQSYTVWANANLATTNWFSYTNVVGDGYVQKLTTSITTSQAGLFYRLSSP